LDEDIECEECIKIIPKDVLNESFKCGKCRKELKMYGEMIELFSDKYMDEEFMRELNENSFSWSFYTNVTNLPEKQKLVGLSFTVDVIVNFLKFYPE
jgi:hypothetical protein